MKTLVIKLTFFTVFIVIRGRNESLSVFWVLLLVAIEALVKPVCRVPSGVCIYIPGYVYIPFSEIGYVKGMYLTKKVCKTAFTAMFPGYLKCKLAQNVFECLSTRLFPLKIGPPHPI